ncbi:MAG: hypothetical protein IKS48_12000 [Eubacterium sp.]|nr:hypothetical protein [Eubacterium sp.]
MELKDVMKELESMPKETLVFKVIKGKKQPYLQWSENGKTKSKYVKQSDREQVFKRFERKNELKTIYNDLVDKLLEDYHGEYYVSDVEKPYGVNYNVSEQLISQKDSVGIYSVERNYINSKKYHDIFSSLPLSHEVQERLYIEAGRLLEYVDGKNSEHMIAISSRTGKLIVDNLNREGCCDHTSFTADEYKKIQECEDSIIVLHNHSSNGRPSARDIISYANDEKVRLSLILCHTGIVYALCNANKNIEQIYEDILEREKERWNDITIAKIYATNDLYRLNDKLGKNQKLFEMRRF